ncbi:hypothetical protein CU102_00415 [Phyllobacterium brassicacearum]|uniref:Uncharacterized protein n=1 Tax=Phyllobacterium brassicacearum TaxID=314235 RepID=A0A2P7BVS1_9HYPH|nr:hypothetical protein CU102_00415 [Phyllobacterium brassicacearum]TDQ35984.1 hypothetical protein DEV91_101470 [Phyllobacterium brassicacearum]
MLAFLLCFVLGFHFASSEGGFYDYEKFRWTVNSTNWKGFVLWYLICALVYACLLREWFGWW